METLEELVKNHSNELFGYLIRYMGNRASAEDALSEVFVKLIENYTEDPDFLWRPWLFRVATNVAIGHIRKQKIRKIFLLREIQCHESGVEEDGPSGVDVLKLRTAVDSLGKRHKPVIIMRVYHEMSYEEIAKSLDINVGTVKSRISEAKEKLKIALGEKVNDAEL
jgi:RNA polymerase sigma-70 factor (ECF subfamily)